MVPLRARMLTPEEDKALTRITCSRKLCAGRVRRAQIVLLSTRGLLAEEIAEELHIHERTARRWVARFNQRGLNGLDEGKRAGHPRVYSAQDVGLVIETAITKPDALGLPFGSWTLDRLVAYLTEVKGVAMKRSRLSEIFRHEGVRWRHQEGWFGRQVDPDFAPKKGAIEHLSTAPPAARVVVCVEEMGPLSARTQQGQRLVRTHPGKGQPAGRARQERDYGRLTLEGSVFGALQPATGEVLTATHPSRTVSSYVAFLDQIEAWIPATVDRVYVIMDNLNVHLGYDVLLFSMAHPRWEFVFQPRYAAYLNLIEPWWRILKSLALKGRRFETWEDIEAAVCAAVGYWNAHRHPFVWGRRRRHRLPRRFGIASVPLLTRL